MFFRYVVNPWNQLAHRQKRILMAAAFLLAAAVGETCLMAFFSFTMVGFDLNPAVRIHGIPLWMNSARSFFDLFVRMAILLCVTLIGLAYCVLCMAER